jgi:hypothetical protein
MRPVRQRGLLGAEAPREIARSGTERTVERRPVEPLQGASALQHSVALRSAGTAPHDLRPLNAPTPLRVQLDASGRVVALWRSGRLTPRRIAAIQDRWRIDDEWWREHAVSRMYYALLLDDGTLLTVYHDLRIDQWFEQRS